MSRLGRYRESERRALARFEESCRLGGKFDPASAREAGEG
jgi:hypothetical protein